MPKASPPQDWIHQIYHVPIYSIADASRYLHIPVPTLKTWLTGRSYPTKMGKKDFTPLIQRPNPDVSQLSFTNLVEAHVLRVIRTEHKIALDKVRLALDYMSEQFQTPHPLVQKQFQTDGADLFLDQIDHLINVSRSGQLAIREILKNLLTRVEWNEEDIAARLFPFVETSLAENIPKILTIDPNISFGKPTITGTGIPTKIVTELYDSGDDLAQIATDYNCTEAQIQTAILFESKFKPLAA